MVEVYRFHPPFLEDLRRQHLQDKNNLNPFQVFRQQPVTIQATGDDLPDAMFMKALADFPKHLDGRFGITHPVHRGKAAIQNQPDPPMKLLTQDVSDLADQTRPVCGQAASRPEGRIRMGAAGKGESVSRLREPAGRVQGLADRSGNSILSNQAVFCIQKGSGRRQALGTNLVASAAGGAVKGELRTLPKNPAGRAVLRQKWAGV